MAVTPELFINREMSWFACNARVLHEARDDRNPLLERLKFLSIFSTQLDATEWQSVDDFFESDIFPVLTPLGVDPTHPFPYISNLSLSLAVQLYDPDNKVERFARIKVPKSLPRWVPTGRVHQFIPVEQVIAANLGALFPGMEILGSWAFRVTRYSDLEVKASDETEDLLTAIEEQVFQRRFTEVVRVEVQTGVPDEIRAILVDELREEQTPEFALTPDDVVDGGSLLELGDMMSLATLDITELRDEPFAPVTPVRLRGTTRSIFDVIRERDVLVHHRYESFTASVEQFVQAAAVDPDVLAIKMTLYRTSGDTPTVSYTHLTLPTIYSV